MQKRETIRKAFALVLLLVAVFSATPKKYLHDWVADHTDCYAATSEHETSVSQVGFNCHCEDLVVSTPFLQATFSTDFLLPLHHNEFVAATYRQFNLITRYTKDLRGPPAAA